MRVKFFYRLLRSVTYFILFFFCWSYLELFEIPAAFAATNSGGAKGQRAETGKQKTAEEKFQESLDRIREAGADHAKLKAERDTLELLDTDLQKQFKETEAKISGLPDVIKQRHRDFTKKYSENLSTLKTHLDSIEKSKTDDEAKVAAEKTRGFLESVRPPSCHQKLDPQNLPFRARKAMKPREPRLNKEQFEKDFSPQKSLKSPKTASLYEKQFGRKNAQGAQNFESNSLIRNPKSVIERKPILVASNGSLAGLLSSASKPETNALPFSVDSVPSAANIFELPSTAFTDSTQNYQLALATDLPTSDDLAETPEVYFTQEIRDLAAQLGNNSLRIFEAVCNNFRYEPYYGSLKGAQQTFREKAGNDFDLASLLISVYRAAGIPARYVVATISMPLPQAQSWLGVDDPKMVGRLLASAGVPVAVDYLSGNIRIEHVLVQAWVPFQNGRGALNGPGDTWVYTDPSFKETKVTQILSQTIPSFDQTQYLNQLRPEDPSEYYSGLLQENLNITVPGRTVYAIARHREIVPLNFGMLLGMPQYDIITAGGHFQEIPDQFRYKVAFELTDPETLEPSLIYQFSTVELAGKRVTLSYSPATSTDQAAINNYGDIYSTPAYLVKLKPELKLEGASITQGSPTGSGAIQPFIMKFISPMGDSDQVVNNAVAGAYYAVAFDLQTVTQGMVFERTQKLQAMNDLIDSGGTASLDDHAGELLYVTALTYFQKLDAANKKAQEMLKFTDLRGVSEAIFSIDVQAAYLFGIPMSADVSGMYIDVDRDTHLPIPVDGNTDKIKEYNLLIGSNSSYFEHKIIEDIYPTEAISAVKGLQVASAQGTQVYTINKDNIGTILPLLQIRNEIKTDIENAINAGEEVICPQHEIQVNDWLGLSYVVMNPTTGEAAYMISGGLAGGDSIGISILIWIKAKALSQNVAADAETLRIESSVERDSDLFPGADNEYGTPDDVKLLVANEHQASQPVWGPQYYQNTHKTSRCFDHISSTYAAPNYEIAAPLLELTSDVMNSKIFNNLTVSNMVVGTNSGAYGRISMQFSNALNDYIQILLDAGMKKSDMRISSVYRTWYHNCELPTSVPNSNHMDGIAADVVVGETNKLDAAQFAVDMGFCGVGFRKYDGFVHVDLGERMGRTW